MPSFIKNELTVFQKINFKNVFVEPFLGKAIIILRFLISDSRVFKGFWGYLYPIPTRIIQVEPFG